MPPPPYSSGNGAAEQAVFGELAHDVDREGLVVAAFADVGLDLALGELLGGVVDELLGFGELHGREFIKRLRWVVAFALPFANSERRPTWYERCASP